MVVRKGGVREQVRQIGLDQNETNESADGLGQWLVGMFQTGKLSARECGAAARAHALSDVKGSKGTVVSELASCGSSGAHPGNMHRDIMKKCQKFSSVWPQVYEADIPMWDYKRQEKKNDTVWFMLPHELVNCAVLQHGIDKFTDLSDQPELRSTLEGAMVKGAQFLCLTLPNLPAQIFQICKTRMVQQDGHFQH